MESANNNPPPSYESLQSENGNTKNEHMTSLLPVQQTPGQPIVSGQPYYQTGAVTMIPGQPYYQTGAVTMIPGQPYNQTGAVTMVPGQPYNQTGVVTMVPGQPYNQTGAVTMVPGQANYQMGGVVPAQTFYQGNVMGQVPMQLQDSERSDGLPDRGYWQTQLEGIAAVLSYSIGFGYVWRFPYLMYRYGGSAFLIPYIFFLVILGLPLVTLQVCLGQYTSYGITRCWGMARVLQGVGIAMALISAVISIYYNVLVGYTGYYFIASYSLPWETCDNAWNTANCHEGVHSSPSEEYWYNRVLLLSAAYLYEIGSVQEEVVGCNIAVWILITICLMFGVKVYGKIACITLFGPVFLLIIHLGRSMTLPESATGRRFALTPDYGKLQEWYVWKVAFVQVFYSLVGYGGITTLSSYNRFRSSIVASVVALLAATILISVMAAVVVFSYLGFLAGKLGVSVGEMASSGPDMLFVRMPSVFTTLPVGRFWSSSFFLMMFLFGFGTQLAFVETAVTGVLDIVPRLRRLRLLVMPAFSVLLFLLGIPYCTEGGLYFLHVIDSYAGTWNILLLFAFICPCVLYGNFRFRHDLTLMTGSRYMSFTHGTFFIFSLFWLLVCPLSLLGVALYTWIKETKKDMLHNINPSIYPDWSDSIGLLLACAPFVCVIVTPFIIALVNRSVRSLFVPPREWGPALTRDRAMVNHIQGFIVDLKKPAQNHGNTNEHVTCM